MESYFTFLDSGASQRNSSSTKKEGVKWLLSLLNDIYYSDLIEHPQTVVTQEAKEEQPSRNNNGASANRANSEPLVDLIINPQPLLDNTKVKECDKEELGRVHLSISGIITRVKGKQPQTSCTTDEATLDRKAGVDNEEEQYGSENSDDKYIDKGVEGENSNHDVSSNDDMSSNDDVDDAMDVD
ncbi:MAG: hypothetical protein Q9183_000607 [Haloplaca sp. 2 TL-2023]